MVGYKTIQSGPRRPERLAHHHLARPRRAEPARERADRPDVRGRQLARRLPAAGVRRRGRQPDLALQRRRRGWAPARRPRSAPSSWAGSGTRAWPTAVEPAGVATVASSPVSGGLVQENGRFQTQGTTSATATIYRAASGAYVFASGTNNWWRGLAPNVHGQGEPDADIKQADGQRADRHGRARRRLPLPGCSSTRSAPPWSARPCPANGATSVLPNADLSATLRPRARPGVGRRRRLHPHAVERSVAGARRDARQRHAGP